MQLFYSLSLSILTMAFAGNTSLRERGDTQHKLGRPSSVRGALMGMSDQDVVEVLEDIRGTVWHKQLFTFSDPTPDNCESPLNKWMNEQIEKMGPEVFEWLSEKHVFEMPFMVKALLDRFESGEYIDANGEETEDLIARHESAKAFWESVDIDQSLDTHRIKLLGVHGTILQNDLALRAFLFAFGLDASLVPEIQDYIETKVPDSYNNPLFTLNAIAVPQLLFGLVPPAIAIGDGVLAFMKDAGLKRDGPDFILAHEFGHQMQFGINAFRDYTRLPKPEQTRLTELMADALGGYYLAHNKGGNMPVDHIQELHEAAFMVGDCNATAAGHHGTPWQRECAAEWGASEAMSSPEIMHPEALQDVFDSVLDEILAVDVSVCKSVASRV